MRLELRVGRLIDAPLEEVFDAYTDPEAQKVWFTILDPEMIVEIDVDFRIGGKWAAAWGFSPDQMFRETQVFQVIERPHRIVTRSSGSSPDGLSLETDIEITFQDDGGKTLMTVVQTGFPDEEVRDFFANTAWIGFFDRFTAYFAARARS